MADLTEEERATLMRTRTYWWCGRCRSMIPLTYWHRCDDNSTHTAPVSDHAR